LLVFCDKIFIKTCPVLDGHEDVTGSNLEREVRVTEKIIDQNNDRTY